MRTRIILNPTAGAGRAAKRLQALRPLLESHWHHIDWQQSRSAQHLTDLATEAAQADYEQVIVAGGDGTVHFVANGLVGSHTALGILPLGTGNDIAVNVGLPRNIEAAVRVLIQGHRGYFDVVQAGTTRFYYCVLGIGMDTLALQRINASHLPRGQLMYSGYALRTLLDYQPQWLTIQGDGIQFSGLVTFVAVANTATYAGGIPIAPGARVDDGYLDVCIIPAMPLLKSLRCFGRLLKANHVHMPEVLFKPSTTLQLTSKSPLPITLDGELTDLTTPLTVKILPKALSILGGMPRGQSL